MNVCALIKHINSVSGFAMRKCSNIYLTVMHRADCNNITLLKFEPE